MYNLSQSAGESMNEFFLFANTLTGDISLLGYFSIALFFIVLAVNTRNGFDSALLISSTISFVISALWAWGGFCSLVFPMAFLAIMAFTYLYMSLTGK